MADTKSSVALIITSTRTPRVGPDVADFVKHVIENKKNSNVKLSVVDVAEFKLPVYDEPVVPFQVPDSASFTHQHSIRWSAEIKKYAGYIFVIPEYNYGMSGGTKNAIDYLKNEWIGKPVVIVSYGITGGKIASGQVQRALEGLELKVCPTRPQLTFGKTSEAPDVFTAMSTGKLGDSSRENWTEDSHAEILRAFGELEDALKSSQGTVNE